MKTLRNYLLVLTLVVATFSFAGCGNKNKENETTSMRETTTEMATTHGGNSGIMNDTTDNDGVIGDIADDVESGVNDIESGVNDMMDNNSTTKKNNNNNKK